MQPSLKRFLSAHGVSYTMTALIALAGFTPFFPVRALPLPDTMYVKVILYDKDMFNEVNGYRAAGYKPNPNFPASCHGNKPGMVMPYLSADRKPIFKANLCSNGRLNEWFRPSATNAFDPTPVFSYDSTNKRWFWTNLTNYSGRPGEFVGPHYNAMDSMRTIVVYDSLPFRIKDRASGTYIFSTKTFFPLDRRGYGDTIDWASEDHKYHNYGFTMEIHHKFKYTGTETFTFSGDDDVWLFINDSLVIDIGGVGAESPKSIVLDQTFANRYGLQIGKSCGFDFFYAERLPKQSHCEITTNILTPAAPNRIIITDDSLPPDTSRQAIRLQDTLGCVAAGNCVTLYTWIVDDTGAIRTDLLTRWEVRDSMGNSFFIDTTAHSNTFCPTKAHGSITVFLTAWDPNYPGVTVTDSIIVCVGAGAAHHLLIEGAPDPAGNSRNDNPVTGNTVHIPADARGDSVYAIIRDRYGNFVAHSQSTAWRVISGSAVAGALAGRTAIGEGVIRKVGPPGIAFVEAENTDMPSLLIKKDTVRAVVDTTSYTQLRMYVMNGPVNATVSGLSLRLASDTMLYVEGLRGDGLGWEPVYATWSLVNITSQTAPPYLPAPSSSTQWRFAPADTGSGSIRLSFGGATAIVPVTITAGDPAAAALYPKPGQPGAAANNAPYASPPQILPFDAGYTIPLYAKLFDAFGHWLSDYEASPLPGGATIQWSATDAASGLPIDASRGALSTTQGAAASFTARTAYDTFDIIATFTRGSIQLQARMRIAVRPSQLGHHLVIEASPDSSLSLTSERRVSTLIMLGFELSDTLYAMIRDGFGNFVRHADSAQWSSGNGLIAAAQNGGRLDWGEGVVTRAADSGAAWIVSEKGLLRDSALVVLSTIYYRDVRIVVNDGGLKSRDSVVLRSDQDTTFFIQGKRSDNDQWELIPASWFLQGLSAQQSPLTGSSYRFFPAQPESGLIVIASPWGQAGAVLRDTVRVFVRPGIAQRLVLYPSPGNPLGMTPYPDPLVISPITAGSPVRLVAKLFSVLPDGQTLWLSDLESPGTAVAWTLTKIEGGGSAGVLSAHNGAVTTWSATDASVTVRITASYTNEYGRVISDDARFSITAAAAHHLVIEADPNPAANHPNEDFPAGSVSLGQGGASVSVYAVIRDLYSNFVDFSKSTEWTSFDSAVARAYPGVADFGEGVIAQAAVRGTTLVSARNASRPDLADTVAVTLSSTGYDSLRIVSNVNVGMDSVVVSIDSLFTVNVLGLRSDGKGWEPVPANWFISGTLRDAAPQPPAAATSWSFMPGDTGGGSIVVSYQNAVPDTMTVRFLPGTIANIVLYPDMRPASLPYVNPSAPITILAGHTVPLAARGFDKSGIWLPQYGGDVRYDRFIQWKAVEVAGASPAGVFDDSSGFVAAYTPRRAGGTVLLIARFGNGVRQLLDTVAIAVAPDTSSLRLCIEGNADRSVSPYAVNRIDSLVMNLKRTYVEVYAVLRDTLGNWFDYSKATLWTSMDSGLAIASESGPGIGQGRIEKKLFAASGQTWVRAAAIEPRWAHLGLHDSVRVIIQSFYYRALRIVADDSTDMASLTMTTNDDTTLKVQGLRSDGLGWENAQATWEISYGLRLSPNPPALSSFYSFSPADTAGQGWIRVTMGDDGVTSPDTVPVLFTRGALISADFEILTPPQGRIAGDTILGVVRIKNRDGLVTGRYCVSGETGAVYSDALGRGDAGRPLPAVITSEDRALLGGVEIGFDAVDECWLSGVDTVKFVLYFAPAENDSMHMLTVRIGSINAATQPFTLLPADTARIAIENFQGREMPDTTLRSPSDFLIVFLAGFDRYGNKIPRVIGDWATTESLHGIDRGSRVSRIYYETNGVEDNETGYLVARSGARADSMHITVRGPAVVLRHAYSGDADGNGYLDRLELHLSKPLEIPRTLPEGSVSILHKRGGVAFFVDSIRSGAAKDSVFVLHLRENKGLDTTVMQTGWILTLSFSGIPGAGALENFPCEDGAGPVIARVTKRIRGADGGTKDLVSVVFSEPVMDTDGRNLWLLRCPAQLFDVWRRDPAVAGAWINATAGLKSVPNLLLSTPDSVVFTVMSDVALTDHHYFSIAAGMTGTADSACLVHDRIGLSGNPAVQGNRKVPVVVIGTVPEKIKIGPNPATPTARHGNSRGSIDVAYAPQAIEWATQDGGLAIQVTVTLPKGGIVPAKMIVYDHIGNPVIRGETADMLATAPQLKESGQGRTVDILLYWNGLNSKGMKVAPGVYALCLVANKQKFTVKIGITR